MSLWEGHRALITGAAREGNLLSGRCSGICYRGWYCKNVTIHPPDNTFPVSYTKTERREAFVWQQVMQSHDMNSRVALYVYVKKLLSPILFSLLAHRTEA